MYESNRQVTDALSMPHCLYTEEPNMTAPGQRPRRQTEESKNQTQPVHITSLLRSTAGDLVSVSRENKIAILHESLNHWHPCSESSGIRVVLVVVLMASRHRPPIAAAYHVLPRPPIVASRPPISLKLSPSLHGNLAAVEFALIFDAGLFRLFIGRLSRVTPRKVVKLPERVHWKNKVPDRERQEVDKHPHDVGPRMRRNDDQHRGKTQNQA
jgi:hypothetical protein